jgi:hypothetical protein
MGKYEVKIACFDMDLGLYTCIAVLLGDLSFADSFETLCRSPEMAFQEDSMDVPLYYR